MNYSEKKSETCSGFAFFWEVIVFHDIGNDGQRGMTI